ncbi:hypothetical protein [Streptomyces chrestomyceticus]|uniref:hypothetical protein n=1 Tax=Streptomyces chrestomyceticus TaxID=68185 RepID=UPI0037ACF6C6
MVDETTRIDAAVDLWVEVSTDGQVWKRSERLEEAHEVGRTCGELRAILATYVAVAEAMGPRFRPLWPWLRVVMQGAETGRVLAVVPRRWNTNRRMYDVTGGEWMVTDTPDAYRMWLIDHLRRRVTKRAA